MILDDLAAYAGERVRKAKESISAEEMRSLAFARPKGAFPFTQRLKKEGMSFLCEVKKASPSKGVIDAEFPYLSIAREYEAAGADCVSCLTEPKWFLGSDDIFREIRAVLSIPMLRKDFTVDEYQILEAKCLGADAVLLICALLDTATVAKYLDLCGQLGLSAVVEAHNEDEIRSAVSAGAGIIGVNNRNLKDFTVDVENAARLRDLVPGRTLFVAESGIEKLADLLPLKAAGVDAVLVGEAMMRAADKRALLAAFREVIQ